MGIAASIRRLLAFLRREPKPGAPAPSPAAYAREEPQRLQPLVFINVIYVENLMDAKYKITGGQQGAVGDNARAENFTQVWAAAAGKIDLAALAAELTALRTALAGGASAPEHFNDLGKIAAAEQAARKGDGPGALEQLKSVGAWLWGAATKIGIGVAIAAAKTALGI